MTTHEHSADYARLLAEVESWIEHLTWKRPEVCPCDNPEACCGSVESCDAMCPSVPVVGASWLRKQLDGFKASVIASEEGRA